MVCISHSTKKMCFAIQHQIWTFFVQLTTKQTPKIELKLSKSVKFKIWKLEIGNIFNITRSIQGNWIWWWFGGVMSGLVRYVSSYEFDS